MSRKLWLAGLSLLLLPLGLAAQEAEEDERPAEPRRQIRVLEDPYDIASFYRSSQSQESYGGGGYFGYQPAQEFAGRYPIAGYYRSGGAFANPGGYGRFWNATARPYRTIWTSSPRHRRSFGQRGELFLMAPTFLAPVVPLNEHSFGR